jgi:hypothetical protein
MTQLTPHVTPLSPGNADQRAQETPAGRGAVYVYVAEAGGGQGRHDFRGRPPRRRNGAAHPRLLEARYRKGQAGVRINLLYFK